MAAPKARLVQGSVSAGLARLSAPMVAGISASIVAGVAEAWFLAQVGTLPLAAYSFTFAVTGALMSLSLGISIGLSSVLARTVGRGDAGGAKQLASNGVSLAAVVMLVVSVAGFFTIDPLFTLLGADHRTLPLVRDYMEIWYLSLVFMAVPSVGANALRATGDASISGTILVAGSVLQIILGPLLIFGLLGLPALGLQGAALAHLISRLLLFAVTLLVLHYRERLLDYTGLTLASVWESWRQILTVGIPATATNLIGPVSTAIVVSLLADFSQETVAGFGIASRIESMFVIPLFALSASIGPFVGQNWGADRKDRANKAMRLSFFYSLIWGGLVALALLLLRHDLVALFDDDPQVLDTAARYLLIVPVSYGTWGMLMMASAIFNSLGRPVSSTIMSVTRMLVIYVPLAYLGKHFFGVPGIFFAAATANLVMGIVGFTWNRRIYAGH